MIQFWSMIVFVKKWVVPMLEDTVPATVH